MSQTFVAIASSRVHRISVGDKVRGDVFMGKHEEYIRTEDDHALPRVFFMEEGVLAAATVTRYRLAHEIADMLNDTVNPQRLCDEAADRDAATKDGNAWLFVMREKVREVARFQVKFGDGE